MTERDVFIMLSSSRVEAWFAERRLQGVWEYENEAADYYQNN
jgi:hypothetical protein